MARSREGKPTKDELGKLYRRGKADWSPRMEYVDGLGYLVSTKTFRSDE